MFDVLALAGADVRGEPYAGRRERLQQLLGDARVPLVLMPMTRDIAGARARRLHGHADGSVEGVVVKHLQYGLPARSQILVKVRTHQTAEAVVCGVTGPPGKPQPLCSWRLPQPPTAGCASPTTPPHDVRALARGPRARRSRTARSLTRRC
ncbi:hypothetical protein [Pseudonocardia nigra]|uniref:hypothetical protein n=1 Tax=Pseudonocardia nigra TaxID=1921578 RepID=UPI001FE445F2|nr:hypothetical protein [Pseudonocardia nigra]